MAYGGLRAVIESLATLGFEAELKDTLVLDKHELGAKVTQPAPGSGTSLVGGNEIRRVR